MKIVAETVQSEAFAHSLLDKIRRFLSHCGLPDALQGRYDPWIYTVIVAFAALAAMCILRFFASQLCAKLRHRKKGTLSHEIADSQLIARLLWTLPPLVVLIMLQLAFTHLSPALQFVERLCAIAVVSITVWAINTLITAIWNVISAKGDLRNRPMKGLAQIIQGIFIAMGVIISVSILIDRSPITLITGLGAFAAVLMLIFKDTILGFVSGVQLSQYDMVRKGDWIEIPGTPVNGTVLDVTLNTVKVQNFDNTYITLPPYTLISQPVQNWRGMTESGGRRIMRSYTIDLNTVRFCSPEMLDSLSDIELLKPYRRPCRLCQRLYRHQSGTVQSLSYTLPEKQPQHTRRGLYTHREKPRTYRKRHTLTDILLHPNYRLGKLRIYPIGNLRTHCRHHATL